MNSIPCSVESEIGVLSAILSQGHEAMEKLTSISQDMFSDSKNKLIFSACVDLWKSLKPLDAVTVTCHLTESQRLERAGGAYYISGLTGFPTDSHLKYYTEQMSGKYRLRKLMEIGSNIMETASQVVDFEDYISSIEREFYTLAEKRQDDNLLNSSYVKVMDVLSKIKSGEGIGAIETGIEAIDAALMGIVPGMMDVYAAEAGCGKTSMVEMIAIRFLMQDRSVLIFQRDMTPEGFLFRLACRMSNVTVSHVRRHGRSIPLEVEKVEKSLKDLSKSKLLLYSPDGCSGSDVRSIVRREVRRSDIKLVMVDHVRTLRHSKNTSWDGLEENSGYIRQSTNETGIPHVVLTHINREGAKSARPTISDIKGGDQLKDDSDNCCVMWAPEGKPEFGSTQQSWKVNFAFDKCRWDWSTIQTMNYNGPKMRFEKL